jgi:hypothetical protein
MPFSFSLCGRCSACNEKGDDDDESAYNNTVHYNTPRERSPTLSNEKKQSDQQPNIIQEILLSDSKTATWRLRSLNNLLEIANRDRLIENYVIPAIEEKIRPSVTNKATFKYNSDYELEDASNSLLNVLNKTTKNFNNINQYGWTQNIFQEDFEKTILLWIHCKKHKQIYINKNRFVSNNKILYTITWAVPVYNESKNITHINGTLYEIDEEMYNSIEF